MKFPLKMRFKVLALCLLCIMIALLLQTWLFSRGSSRLIYDQAKKENFSLLQNMQGDLHSIIKGIENKIVKVYNRQQLMRDLKADIPIRRLKERYHREAYNIATEYFDTSDRVVALYLYDSSDQIISTYRRAVTPRHNYPLDIYDETRENNADVVKNFVHSDRTTMLVSGYYNAYREKDLIRLAMKIYSNSNIGRLVGYLVCDMDCKAYQACIKRFITDENMFVWLQPAGDRTITSVGSLEGEELECYQDIEETIRQGQSEHAVSPGRNGRVFFRVEQEKYDFSVCALVPQALLEANQRSLTSSLLSIALLMAFIAFFITFVWTKSLTRPLEELTRMTQRIKEGETDLRISVKQQDEIGELGRNFNEMLDQIQTLLAREYETKLLLERAEYNAMQAQINPHFFYNTLDTMSSIAQIRQCEEVSLLCQSLSNIFRYSLDMKNPFSTVAKEIVHLKNYIYVMNVRMQDNVQYEFDIDDAALKCSVPRICIQPLVENALNHGLRNIRGEKKVAIRAKAEGDSLVIAVEDNGTGIAHADKVNRKMEENNLELVAKGNSIGLVNINARVKMLYGDAFGIRVESKDGKGTAVRLTIARQTMGVAEQWRKNTIKS
ncbi:MAG TPA: ATP-binding protein [Lachnospiraceae bacterium]|nr:ATP-binding protein [Lachnospiraceae bacterium]